MPCGLSTVARIRKVPVCGLYDGSAKVILPGVREQLAVDQHDLDDVLVAFGAEHEPPVAHSLRMRCISFSDRLKLTHIGVSTETVVSWAFCGLR